jgi:hypothetical protein
VNAHMTVRRKRGLRQHIYATIDDDPEQERPTALAVFTPAAIRALAPNEGPQTARAWRDCVRGRVRTGLSLIEAHWLERMLRVPVTEIWLPGGDLATKENAIARLNSRFKLREGDVQRLVALYARLKAEAVSAVLAALDELSVIDARNPSGRPALSVVISSRPTL